AGARRGGRRGVGGGGAPPTGGGLRATPLQPGRGPLELVEVHLPAGARVAYTPASYAFLHHQIWVLDGMLRFEEGDTVHELAAGDCLQLGSAQPCSYVNPTDDACRYLVAPARRGG
ncbi:MAG: cupin domain-containing protein, partial [Pseudonocardia sp.]|nr:cupin domain-containing protein [Pseudonocardia sp.]